MSGAPDKSLAERLRALFGASIDPQIELGDERSLTDSPSAKTRNAPVVPKSRYVSRGELARGGMGVILKVWDQDLKRALAMKVMLATSGSAPSGEGSLRLRRFLEEAQITGQLEHPGVVPVHEIGLDQEGRLYFTMRLVKGRDLRTIFALVHQHAEGWTTTRALQVMLKVCEAMAFAHDKGVIHRDLKPANIMVGRFGETYVMDWGLAKLTHQVTSKRDGQSADVTQSLIHTDRGEISPGLHLDTLDGDIVGTPSYMAPEQASGRTHAVGARADIYAVGAMLYHLLTGQVPYVAADEHLSASAVLQRVLAGPPTSVLALNRNVPAELVAICEKAMAREPGARYATMLELGQNIQAYLEGRVVSAYQVGAVAEFTKWMRRNRGMAAGLAAALVMAVGGLLGVLYVQSTAKNQLATKNLELEHSNVALSDTNVALAVAEKEARASAENILLEQRQVKRQSYFANITAADAGLSSFEPLRAQHRLGECDASFRRWEWQHLTARADASLQVLVESRGPFSLAGSRDGQRIAVGASSQIVRVLDVNSNTLLLEAKLTMPIVCAALNHDGSLLAVGCLDGTVPLWDVNAKQSLAVLGDARPIVNGPAVYGAAALAFDPTGTRLVVGGDDQLARVWNLASRDVAVTLRHNGTVQAVAVSPDGRWIATGTVDNTIRVWDANSGQLSSTLVGHQSSGATQDSIAGFGGVLALDFHPSGELLASGAADATIRIWDLAARTSRLVLRGSRASITSIQFSADGKLLASASSDSMVRTWQVDSGELVHEYLGHSNRATAVCFALSGSELVSSSWDGTVRTWSLEVAEPITTMKDDMPINGLSFFDDARRIVTTHVDGGARVWDSVTGQLTQVLACERSARIEPYQGAAAAATSPDGKRLFIATNSMVHVFDAVSLAPLGKWQPPRTPLNSLAISGSRLVTGSWSSDVALWNSESGALVKHWNVPDGLFRVTISNDATLLAASSQEGIIRIWDAETGERRLELPAMQGVIFGLAFSPDGLSLLASTVTGSLQVFDTDTGDVVLDLVGQQAGSLAVVYSPDGSRIASGGVDAGVRIWDAASGELMLVMRGHLGGAISSLAFSPDGSRIAAADWSGAINIWETVPARERVAPLRAAAATRVAAQSVLYPLLDQGKSGTDLAVQFAADTLLRDDVRTAIVNLARVEPYATSLADAAWTTLRKRDANPNDYQAALRKAEEACRLLPARPLFERTLALARYRVGAFHAAATGDLARLHDNTRGSLAILAMAYQRLARPERARELLAAMRALAPSDADSEALAREAEGAINDAEKR